MPGVHPELGKPTIVFVTIGTKDRRPWLATDAYHSLLSDVWSTASKWRVGRYVLMPDHMHFFTGLYEPEFPFENWMKYWRSLFTRQNPNRRNQLQTDAWHRRLRSDESYAQKWDYVRHNPTRHGLVRHPAEWAYQGEIFKLDW